MTIDGIGPLEQKMHDAAIEGLDLEDKERWIPLHALSELGIGNMVVEWWEASPPWVVQHEERCVLVVTDVGLRVIESLSASAPDAFAKISMFAMKLKEAWLAGQKALLCPRCHAAPRTHNGLCQECDRVQREYES